MKRKSSPVNHSLILGVSGGIGVYKALELLRLFQKAGFETWVVMTENAQRFVSPLSFQTFTPNPVITSLFTEPLVHIELQKREILLIAPATANIIGKIACGICDDALSTITCAFPGPKVLVPAMNKEMWENPVVQENIRKLKSLGYHIMEPKEGELASGEWGKGRMPEPEEIFAFVQSLLSQKKEGILSGLKILITAGRTEEDIDPVRVLTNRSSGRLGKELAEKAKDWGADCLLIAGRMEEKPEGVKIISCRTASEMLSLLKRESKKNDILIMTAAVGDYKPLVREKGKKIKKKSFSLPLVKNVDILESLREEKLFKVGFSLDSEAELIKEAKRKLKEKNLDLICANSFASLESDFIEATILSRDGEIERLPRMTKREFAAHLLQKIKTKFNEKVKSFT
jgi:phosphopantothenoylcysteine decarboxylase/phosphopantothenate--cysteine ligase|uniref:Coenzyme A biosynthesis bifunctional protein CoaBC n=1 Tax=candidate division WOR-3 bacterium TaxID=2052148 RepID=A0A7C3YSF8_UNCW3